MRKFNLAISIAVLTVAINGCTLPKMIKLAKQQDLKVSPSPLELHGGEVSYTMSAVLPPKMLPKGKVYTVKNFYQYSDKEIETGSVEFKADDFPNSASSPSEKSSNFKFAYTDDMSKGKLMVAGEAKDPRNGKTLSTPKMEVAVGVITTSTAVKDVYSSAYAAHGYNDAEELINTNLNFYFEQGKSNLVGTLKTDGQTNTEKQKNLAAFIADKNVTRTVTVTGTHSPEGIERINRNLSEERAAQIEKYYRAQMKKYDYKGMADSIKFIIKPVVEDWSGLKVALVAYTGISDASKSQMNRIIDGTGSFEDKEKQLRKVEGYEKVFKEIYPTLRSAKTEILTVKEKLTPSEISVLAGKVATSEISSDTLKLEELLFAATLTNSLSEKEGIYKSAAKSSGSWVAHNNLGAVYLDMAKADADNRAKLVQDAITQLEIAANKKNAPEVHANLVSAYMMQKEYEKAYSSAAKAETAGASNAIRADINAMKGVIEIRNNQYDKAKASFAASSSSDITSFNRGLVSLLTKDFTGAESYFAAASNGDIAADAYYYRAVTAARAKSVDGIIKNLKEAVSKNKALKDKALNDLEFLNFADAIAQAIR